MSTLETIGPDLEAHRKALFGLCYRMTGSAADAEDLVQQTFARALERPPADLDAPLRPWLNRVATRLSIDALRRRKREGYFGPWLPAPVPTDRLVEPQLGPEARYSALESASAAFLLAVEALEPRARAVLVLRDALGWTGPEVAAALDMTPGNVRVVLHRARKTLEAYEAERTPMDEAQRAAVASALRRLLFAIGTGQVDTVVALLTEDVRSVHDANGEAVASVRVLRGREDVLRFYRNIAGHTPAPRWSAELDCNGMPAIAVDFGPREGRYARKTVISVELARDGRIRELRSVIAAPKLHAIEFD